MVQLFYGRYEPVPYWMDQRMAPVSMFEDGFYPGNKQMVPRRGPEIMQQQYIPQRGENNFVAHKRPEMVRDDMYTDMYRRSPYSFNYNYGRDVSVAPVGPAMHPEIMRQQQLRGVTQDDTWVHTTSSPAHGHGQSFPGTRGPAEPPPGMATRFGNGSNNGSDQYRPMPNHGGGQYRQMESSMPVSNHMSNQSNSNRDNYGNNHGSKQTAVSGNGSFAQQGKSLGQGGKLTMQTTSKQSGGNNTKQQNRYNGHDDSSSSSDSEDDDDDYEHGHSNNGARYGTVKSSSSSVKHGHSGGKANSSSHGHKVDSYGYETISKGGVKSSSHSISGSKKSSSNSHGSYGKSSKHGSSQSKISKLFGGGEDSSSSEDDESYGHSKKGGSKLGSSKSGIHQMHGSHVTSFQPNHGSQPKQMVTHSSFVLT